MIFDSRDEIYSAAPILSAVRPTFELPVQLDLPIVSRRLDEWGGMRIALLTVAKGISAEIEFALPSHVLMTHLEVGTAGYEWTNATEWKRMPRPKPRSVIFNPAGMYLRMRIRAHGHGSVLLVIIDPAAIERLSDEELDAKEISFQRSLDLNDDGLNRTLATIREEIECPGLSGKRYRDSLSILLLCHLVRCTSNFAVRRPQAYSRGGLPNWRLKRVLEVIENSPSGNPSLADLASCVGITPTSFCRAFKQSTGVSPHRYVLERRVARAKEMMAKQDLSLTQIALDCGFSSSSKFSFIFKRVTGCSPSNYRRSV